ncbi:MAG TPA: HNH endonuclease, partial [Mycobacterium sp.]|nr:HNH endonuclease [Mycobacterium sp.]
TDITTLSLACPSDNKLIENTGWTTRKRADGRTEWIPPPHLDTGQTRGNNYHPPHHYLTPDKHDNNDGGDDADP